MPSEKITEDGSRFYHGLNFKLDHQRTEYRRTAFILFDLIAYVGGFAFIIFAVGQLLVTCLTQDSRNLLLIS